MDPDKSEKIHFLGFFELSCFCWTAQRQSNFRDSNSFGVYLSIDILMEETIHVDTKKREFDIRRESLLIAISGVFGLSWVSGTDFKNRCSE